MAATYTPQRERYTDVPAGELASLCEQFHEGQDVEVNLISARNKKARWKSGFTVVNVTQQRVILSHPKSHNLISRYPQSVRPASNSQPKEGNAEGVTDKAVELLSECETVQRWTPGPDDVLFITGAPNWSAHQCQEAAEWLADYLKTHDIHAPILLLPYGCQIGIAKAAEVEALQNQPLVFEPARS